MVAGKLRIGTVTGHLALKDVARAITAEKLISKLNILHDSLKIDFGIQKPKIAVLSLNPHSGDEGLLGTEEQQVINPVIEKLSRQGMLVYGPFSSDGFFGSGNYVHFDAILAMYHDQGLTTFKILSEGEGVNFTAGLPVIRTSPAHGTAYEIAGQDKASATSMLSALFTAIRIYRNRMEYKQLTANPLKRSDPMPGDGE
jgi:4-hydroxy-L-threonine phosphate dehydrogenase PdxA